MSGNRQSRRAAERAARRGAARPGEVIAAANPGPGARVAVVADPGTVSLRIGDLSLGLTPDDAEHTADLLRQAAVHARTTGTVGGADQ